MKIPFVQAQSVPVPESGRHAVDFALRAHLRRARDHDRNYREPGCFLFMRCVLDHAQTAGDAFAETELVLENLPKNRSQAQVRR